MWMRVMGEGELLYAMGGWGAPLGIDLHADGLAVFMLLMSTGVGLFLSIYAAMGARKLESRYFWALWNLVFASLPLLFVSGDLFNIYVGLELLGISSVALIALGGKQARVAAMRYLFVTLSGSLAYLLGVALLYAQYGMLDLYLLGHAMEEGAASYTALLLILAGLLMKTALFPLHFWLPRAHAGAPSPVSAVLSALVVKGTFYLLLRFWVDLFPALDLLHAGRLLSMMGAAAILWGTTQALRQTRLKLLVAYSTVAQLGYLFLMFEALRVTDGAAAWNGMLYFAFAHAFAKTAMFLAAGNVLHTMGTDDIEQLRGLGRRMPGTTFAFGLAGVSIMGLPPSGGFIGKWFLLSVAVSQGWWWMVAVMIIGGFLAVGYVFRVLGRAFACPVEDRRLAVSPVLIAMALLPAVASVALGIWADPLLALAHVGAPLTDVMTGGTP
jgi:multicomponent Na+:H+ antiporter subunit D